MLSKFPNLRRALAVGLVAGGAGLAGSCAIGQKQEIQMGREYAAELNRELPMVDDATVVRYVNLLGNQIARQGGRDIQYTFYVVNTDQVNAFAVPGGFIYVNRGLIERTRNLSELAGVMAHEIGHVEERHGVEQLERMQRANAGLSLAYILLGRAPGTLERTALNVGGAAVFASYSRSAEREADAVAVNLLVRSGIDPNGLVTFFMQLLEERERRPGSFEQWFSTHPLTEDRIAETREIIRAIPPEQLRNLTVDSQQYESMKARLRRYPAPPR